MGRSGVAAATGAPRFGWQAIRERLLARRDRVLGLPVRDALHFQASVPVRLPGFDHALVAVVLGLLAFGLVMVYSASVALPDNPMPCARRHTRWARRSGR